jgi:ubiquinone/menaquinone biosynthesis C-methylase UbiE
VDAAEFDRFADEYEQLHAKNIAVTGEKPEFFHEYKVKVLREMTRARGAEPKSLLDFGSGIGNSLPFLRKYFPEARLAGADVSERSLEVAEGRFPGMATGLRIEGERIPAEDGSFDVGFSACVFHHIAHEEHVKWLRELRRVTRAGGMLAVFEHNPLNPLTVRAVNTCAFDENARLIRAREMVERFRESGWREVKARYHVFFPHALAGLRGLEKWMGAVPLGGQYSVVGVKRG